MSRTPEQSKSGVLSVVLRCAFGLLALLVVFLLHSITTSLRASIIWSFVLTICYTGTMILIGVIVSKLNREATVAFVLVAVIVLSCEVSWYWWDYRDFQAQVAQLAASGQLEDSSTTADTFLVAEVSSPGFWGYLKWSAVQGATFDDAPISAGTGAAVVNWGKRLLSLFWALVWAFVAFDKA